MIQLKITPNQLFVLHSSRENRDYGAYIPSLKVELSRLRDKGLLSDQFQITESGTALLDQVDQLMTGTIPIESLTSTTTISSSTTTSSLLTDPKVDKTAWDQYVQTYRKLFPAGAINGRVYRSSPRELTERFKWFFKHYSYSWEVILAATDRYLTTKKQQDGGYSFVRNSNYFIRKNDSGKCDTSELANWCEMITMEREDPDSVQSEHQFKELYKYV